MAAQHRAHRIFEKFSVKPIYVIDYPVASQDGGARPLLELYADGLCEIGAHLHPWVNPPFEEEVSNYTSYPGNLPATLEAAKLAGLTETIADRFGFRPTVYKAGRYGVGHGTTAILERLGYKIDATVVPRSDFSVDEGPDFSRCDAAPYWFGTDHRLLEIPMTVGFAGALAGAGFVLHRASVSRAGRALKAQAVLSRLGLFERIRLTPEGFDHGDHRRLTKAMLATGHTIFSLTYHSPSLAPGHTPYVRNQADLSDFLDRLERYFENFFDELGGRPATTEENHRLMAAPL